MKIYQAQVNDVDQFSFLYEAYLDFYQVEQSRKDPAAYLKERLNQQESVIFVAEDEAGNPVGFTQLYPMFCSLAMQRTWLLYDLYVSAEARQSGVAQALMDRAEQMAKETDSAFIMLSTAVDNHRAQALYEKNGYEKDVDFYTYLKHLD